MTLSFRRVARCTALIGFAALLLTGAARVGVGRYLSSARGKAMVADRLGTAIGMPVEVSEVAVDDGGSSFGFRVMDPADPKAEVLNVPSASTDLSAADFMTGRAASSLRVKGASLSLRVGSDGRVLTPVPPLPGAAGSFPAVVIDGARLSVSQEGRPGFAVSGVSATLTPDGERIAVSGSVNDAKWGVWVIRGELQRDTRGGWVELSSTDAPLDRELLETVPFLPAGACAELAPLGRAAVTIRVTLGADPEVRLSVEVRPTWSLFGVPLGPCFRLTPTSDGHRFEPVR